MIDEADRAETTPPLWRAGVVARRDPRATHTARRIETLSIVVLILTTLFALIGANPYEHANTLDVDTGAASLSPLNRSIWIVLFVLAAPVLWIRRADLPALARATWPLLLLYAWFAITVVFAIDPAASQRRFLLVCLNLAIAAAVVLGVRDSRRIHAALAFSCAIVVGIDLFSWLFLPGLSMTELGLAGIHTHKNTLGSVALLSVFTCATYALGRERRRERLLWGTVALAATALLIASRSKTSGGILLAMALLSPWLLALLRRPPRIVAATMITGLALAAGGALVWMAWTYARADNPLAPFSGITFTQRTDVWRFVWDQAMAHPWRGVGFGSFWDIDPAVQPSHNADVWFNHGDAATNEGHNGYLDLLATTGAPGLLGALFVLYRWARTGLAGLGGAVERGGVQDPPTRALAIFLGGFVLIFLVHNGLESSYFTPNAMFGVIILFVGLMLDRSTLPLVQVSEGSAKS
jgi:O-antigen ligase